MRKKAERDVVSERRPTDLLDDDVEEENEEDFTADWVKVIQSLYGHKLCHISPETVCLARFSAFRTSLKPHEIFIIPVYFSMRIKILSN